MSDTLVPVMVRLTSEQHRRLKVYCARYSLTIGEVVEQSLAATGVFRLPS